MLCEKVHVHCVFIIAFQRKDFLRYLLEIYREIANFAISLCFGRLTRKWGKQTGKTVCEGLA